MSDWNKLTDDNVPDKDRHFLISDGDEVCLCSGYIDFNNFPKRAWSTEGYSFHASGVSGYEWEVIDCIWWKYIDIGSLPEGDINV